MTLRKFCIVILVTLIGSYTGFLINPVFTPVGMLISLLISILIIF
jgi:hypothetical protein